MKRAPATAKINLALVVGPLRDDGKHEVLTVLQRIDLVDRIQLEEASGLRVEGFAGDTLVRDALERARRAWPESSRAGASGSRSRSRSPPASVAAAPTPRPRSGSRTRRSPSRSRQKGCRRIAAAHRRRRPVLPRRRAAARRGRRQRAGAARPAAGLLGSSSCCRTAKRRASTADVYAAFDARDGAAGWEERRQALLDALARVERPRDLAALPPNDLASSPHAEAILRGGRVPRRRLRRRPGALRALPAAARRGGRKTLVEAPWADLDHGTCVVRLNRVSETSSQPAERGPGVWLKTRRVRLSLWIAVLEGIVVAVSHDLTRWTVLGLAIVAGLAWTFGRHREVERRPSGALDLRRVAARSPSCSSCWPSRSSGW